MVSKQLAKEMKCQNSHLHFFYRQFFLTPAPLPTTLSLTSQTAIVTGSNVGLGYHACLQLLERGLSHLILAVRSTEKGEAAKATLLASLPASLKQTPIVEVWNLDLSSYPSIIAFARHVKEFPGYINMVIMNAGVVSFAYSRVTETGNETTIQVNWLSNALLTILLRPILQSKYESIEMTQKPPVISIVGSEGAGWALFKERNPKDSSSILQTLNDEKNFNLRDRYFTSKLLLLLFFREYCSRISVPGSSAITDATQCLKNDVIINNVNPGYCYGTELHRTAKGIFGIFMGWSKRVVGRETGVGARTLAHGGAVAGVESHDMYLSDEKVTVFVPFVESNEGKMVQKKLWEEMVAEFGKVVDFDKVMREGL